MCLSELIWMPHPECPSILKTLVKCLPSTTLRKLASVGATTQRCIVTPAQAGVQGSAQSIEPWIPAFEKAGFIYANFRSEVLGFGRADDLRKDAPARHRFPPPVGRPTGEQTAIARFENGSSAAAATTLIKEKADEVGPTLLQRQRECSRPAGPCQRS